jgi:hypothetical protein
MQPRVRRAYLKIDTSTLYVGPSLGECFGGNRMTMQMKSTTSLVLAALALSACSDMNLFKDSPPPEPTPPPVASVPAPAVPAGKLSATQIKSALSGKSWKWAGPNNSGVTLYANDGSSLVEVTGKGTTTGKWVAKDGQLCESFAPAPFLPKGVPLTCQPMTGGGGAYKVGSTTFTLA